MATTIRTSLGLTIGAVLVAGLFGATSANAQIYPSPEGYCVFSLSDPLPATDSMVTITATAADRAGTPLEGVSGTVSITSQPGDSARLDPSSFVTGPDGTAEIMLHTGDTAGTIEVTGPCDSVEVRATVQVGTPPGPPATGSGTSEGNPPYALGAAAATALLAGIGGVGLLARRRNA